MPDDDLFTKLAQIRKSLDAVQRKALLRVVQSYKSSIQYLDSDIDLLVLQLSEQNLSVRDVKKLKAYQRIVGNSAEALQQFASYLGVELRNEIDTMKDLGQRDAVALLQLQGGKEIQALLRKATPEQIAALGNYVNPGKPLYNKLQQFGKYGADMISQMILNGVSAGKNPKVIAQAIRDAQGMSLNDAMRMMRTVQIYAYRDANQESYQANSDVVRGWYWNAQLDDATCESCIAMHGTFHTVDETLDDHHNGRCLTPGTLVSSSPALAFNSRHYDGNIINIRTASGKFLSVTPNHPILTNYGWITADRIKKGYAVVSNGFNDWTSLGVSPDEYQMPTRVEDIPGSLGMTRLSHVPKSTENLDSNITDSKVDVIWANRLLLDNIKTPVSNPPSKNIFRNRFMSLTNFSRLSPKLKLFHTNNPVFTSKLSGDHNKFVLFWSSLRRHKNIGLCTSTPLSFCSSERNGNNISRNIERFCNRIFGFSRKISTSNLSSVDKAISDSIQQKFIRNDFVSSLFVSEQPISLEKIRQSLFAGVKTNSKAFGAISSNIFFDSVIEISISTFSGHVYNLQSTEGWYISNNIITHNCTMIPATILSKSNPLGSETAGQDWFKGLPESQQKQTMGEKKWQAWQDGKFDFSQLSKQVDNDVFGTMRTAASLKDLVGE